MTWISLMPTQEDLDEARRLQPRKGLAESERGYHLRAQRFRLADVSGYSFDPTHHQTHVCTAGGIHTILGNHMRALDMALAQEADEEDKR